MNFLKILYYLLFFIGLGLYSVPTSAETICEIKNNQTSQIELTEVSSSSKEHLFSCNFITSHFVKVSETKNFFEKVIFPNLTELKLSSSKEKKWLGLVYLDDICKLANHPNGAVLSQENQKIFQSKELVESWKMAFKHADLRTNTTALSKLNDIAKRGRGIDKTKLTDELNGDLGDVLNKATGDDLTNILNRLDAEHVNGSHLDEITLRLSKYSEVKTELLNNPSQFEFFDEVLRNPENYRELAQLGEIPTSSPLYKWSLGKFRKQILDNAEKLETTVSSNIRNYVDVPDGYRVQTQIHLGDGIKRTIPDDFIYNPVVEVDPITGVEYHRAIIHDSKLHADVLWTDNQYELIIKKFEDGASHVDLKLRSSIDGLELDATVRIHKSDIHKSIGTPDKTGTYLSTSKVF